MDALALLLACGDNTIKKFDLSTGQIVQIGQHTAPVRGVVSLLQNGTSIVISGGWDSRVKFWSWSSPQALN